MALNERALESSHVSAVVHDRDRGPPQWRGAGALRDELRYAQDPFDLPGYQASPQGMAHQVIGHGMKIECPPRPRNDGRTEQQRLRLSKDDPIGLQFGRD